MQDATDHLFLQAQTLQPVIFHEVFSDLHLALHTSARASSLRSLRFMRLMAAFPVRRVILPISVGANRLVKGLVDGLAVGQ